MHVTGANSRSQAGNDVVLRGSCAHPDLYVESAGPCGFGLLGGGHGDHLACVFGLGVGGAATVGGDAPHTLSVYPAPLLLDSFDPSSESGAKLPGVLLACSSPCAPLLSPR